MVQLRANTSTPPYPGGARFAFTIVDDTDVATRDNVEPVYQCLRDLGMRSTKTVWPVGCPEGSPAFGSSETLDDPDYVEFVRELVRAGFEVTWHAATMESSPRKRTRRALARFREVFGFAPTIHANHAHNREGLYWGSDRIDSRLLGWLYGRITGCPRGRFQGHVEGSEYWWGDLAVEHIEYARNLTFADINTLKRNPSMPYRDPRRPLVRRWFSATDAPDVEAFNDLLSSRNLDRLEAEGGASIVATHFGKGFAPRGRLNPETRARLEDLTSRPGWFPTVGELLRWLEARQLSEVLPAREWRSMQWRWAWDLARRRISAGNGSGK